MFKVGTIAKVDMLPLRSPSVCVSVGEKRTSKHCDNSGSGLIEKMLQSAHNISALAQLAKMLYMLNQKGERNGIGDRK